MEETKTHRSRQLDKVKISEDGAIINWTETITSEKMSQEEKVAEQVTIYQKIKSKVSNFLKRLIS